MFEIIKSNEIQNKHELAYSIIKDMILTNQIKSEAYLSERELCGQLNLSRTPVRSALKELCANNLLEYQPGRGIFLPNIGVEDVVELIKLYETLELLAVKLFLRSDALAESLEKMRLIVETIKISADNNDAKNFIKYDQTFHGIYFEMSGNKRLERILLSLYDQMIRCFDLKVMIKQYKEIQSQHAQIIRLAEKKDYDGLSVVLQDHIFIPLKKEIKRYLEMR